MSNLSGTESLDDAFDHQSQHNKNVFVNDGSFLEQFKKMQRGMTNSTANHQSQAKNDESESKANESQKFKFKIQTVKPTNSQAPVKVDSVFDSQVSTDEVSPPEDDCVKEAVEETAKMVASGESTEEKIRELRSSNVIYGFLFNEDGDEYKYYQQRLKQLQSSVNKRKRKRASRWSNQTEESTNISSIPGVVASPVLGGLCNPSNASHQRVEASTECKSLFTDQGMKNYAIQVFGSTNLSHEQWKQLEEQRKMRVLYEMVQAKKAFLQDKVDRGAPKYEYDSDEDTEGGTWEHKLRAREMQKTKDTADTLTEKGYGKHHLGDFLPPEELEKFMEKYEALKNGRAPDLSDYKEFKLSNDNIGYQMLLKLGWSEGQGLGANESGITAPVNKGNTSGSNFGLGLTKPDEVACDDDEFEAYRKRMMLAYRFRPNPLNNPRRAYY